MEHVFSIVMFVLSGALLLYALLVRVSGYDAIPRGYAAKPRDKKQYANKFALLLAMIAAAPAAAGLVGLWRTWAGVIVLIAGTVYCCIGGAKITRIADELEADEEAHRDE